MAISQEIPQPSITKICLKITCLKFHSNFPGANELRNHSKPSKSIIQPQQDKSEHYRMYVVRYILLIWNSLWRTQLHNAVTLHKNHGIPHQGQLDCLCNILFRHYREHQISFHWPYVRGIHMWSVVFRHKWSVLWKAISWYDANAIHEVRSVSFTDYKCGVVITLSIFSKSS